MITSQMIAPSLITPSLIALLGFGKTNQALLTYLNANDQKCVIFDDSFQEVSQDSQGNIFAPPSHFSQFPSTLQVPTPGIPPSHFLIRSSQNLVSEYDLLLSKIKEPQIWISGTNGKTTTTEMLEWILRDFGGVCGGNIGIPLAQMLEQKPKIWILETSSFSLHYTKQVFPSIYLLLPLSEDHISWHSSFECYIQAKLSPLERMQSECIAFIPKALQPYIKHFEGKLFLYEGIQDLQGFDTPLSFKQPFLLDALLALSGAKALTHQDLSAKLLDFKIGLHKIEEFHDLQGRLWVDDSKGTNVDATISALQNYQGKTIFLILGGDDKGADLTPLFQALCHYNVEIFAIGSNAEKLHHLAQTYQIPCNLSLTLEQAVNAIHLKHSKESIAILSPAAASLDQFQSYKHRGETFKKFVKNLV